VSRRVDVLLAAAAILLLALPMLAVAGATALTLGRPILFRQRRAGRGGASFELIKFRTMDERRDASGALLPDEQRTAGLGRWLRRTRLDELPELWNILRGDMSFIGPRPLLPETIASLGREGVLRCAIRPGLTGLAQVAGNSLLDTRQKLAIDLLYVRDRTVALDLHIILRTPVMMMAGERIDAILLERAYARGGGGSS
jgi:lipopolysaccharide/colanic/teichoic acid biosynthesis glycosyltransferase